MEDVSSGYSSTEFLATDTVCGAIEAVVRRAGSVRSSSRGPRPVTMVDNSYVRPLKNGGGTNGSDVSNGSLVGSRLIKVIDFIEDGGGFQKRQAEGCF